MSRQSRSTYGMPPVSGYSSPRLKAVARQILAMPYHERAQIGAGIASAFERMDGKTVGYSEAIERAFAEWLTMETRD